MVRYHEIIIWCTGTYELNFGFLWNSDHILGLYLMSKVILFQLGQVRITVIAFFQDSQTLVFIVFISLFQILGYNSRNTR